MVAEGLSNLIMQFAPGMTELIIILAIIAVVVFFGAKKIPQLAKSFGSATAEFEKARIEAKKELQQLKSSGGVGREKIESIAESIGIDYTNKNDDELRAAGVPVSMVEAIDGMRAVEAIEARPHNPGSVRAALGDFLDIVLRHRAPCAMFMRDTPAVLAAIEPIWQEMIGLSARLHTWIAGPDPTDTDRIRAMGSTNIMIRSQKPPQTEQSSDQSVWSAVVYGLEYKDAERIRADVAPHPPCARIRWRAWT